ncbi:hypothetical protein BGX34_000378 [Mortierella sp. NVP85]|nr:hypothetical protein BGX34_000378 [Mortierella sp. NVP85]
MDDDIELFADYLKSRDVEDMTAIDFFEFEGFQFKHHYNTQHQEGQSAEGGAPGTRVDVQAASPKQLLE